jgi:putative effector of murein hydrolase
MTLPQLALALIWIAATIGAYVVGLAARRRARNHPLVNPVLIALVLVAGLLFLTGTPYADYARATWPITFLLAPATVALGLPLAKNLRHVRASLVPVLAGLVAGSVASMVSGVCLVRWLGGSHALALAMLPKAATTPIAMVVAGQIGAQPTLAASLAMLGGLTAAVCLGLVFALLRVTHGHAIGLAAGTAGSGVGAAQVTPLGEGPAAFAAIGIALNGLITALLAPLVAAWLG